MELVFATNNLNKLREIRSRVSDQFTVLGLKDIGFDEEIPEDHDTLEANALQKAKHIADRYRVNCFADDTGLEIAALNGRPGVYSARYAGEHCSPDDNMTKVLEEMGSEDDRSAQFRTVIALILEGEEYLFDGAVNGQILRERTGAEGFGYDPIFKPEGYDQSFAEMTLEQKNKISHRAKAVEGLLNFIQTLPVDQ